VSASSSTFDPSAEVEGETRFWRFARIMSTRYRPEQGWIALGLCLCLALMPGIAAEANGWLSFSRRQNVAGTSGVIALGPLAVLATWLVWSWLGNKTVGSILRVASQLFLLIFVGMLALLQALSGWIPGPFRLLDALLTNSWPVLESEISTDLSLLFSRVARWQSGVAAGGATQDDLIFAALVGASIWIMCCISAWFVRTQRSGLLAALPILTLLGIALFYGSNARTALLVSLLLALVLQIILHHRTLEARWEETNVDYSGGIFGERVIYVAVVGGLLVMLAGFFPNVSIEPISHRYFDLLAPVNEQVEDFGIRLFPDIKMTSRFRGSTLADGLPNSFLLGSGPELSQREVMRVRTDEAYFYDPSFPGEVEEPVGHYMRGGTLSMYDGLGWSNDVLNNGTVTAMLTPREAFPANRVVADPDEAAELFDPDALPPDLVGPGRKLLTQNIFLSFQSSALYAAPEPIVPLVDYRLERHANGDPLALWASRADQTLRSYSIVSSIPAVSPEQLRVEPMWGESTPLPTRYDLYLQLPATISERTRILAQSLTANVDSPYEKALAIESHLRTFPYDLSVTQPPAEVVDVADYFLFDLQRGYCDYYATSFAALARLSGLPTRFATGFAVGRFDFQEGLRVVTEAQAHSWPEVYFPTYGWIPFEPTAGRPELTRIGLPETISVGSESAPIRTTIDEAPVEDAEPFWHWQMLIWLIPLAALVWGTVVLWSRWGLRTADPWLGLLRWGRRIGRPLAEGETMLEYGSGLADHTVADLSQAQDARRLVAREVQMLSREVSAERYGPEEKRKAVRDKASTRWQSLRAYLRQVR